MQVENKDIPDRSNEFKELLSNMNGWQKANFFFAVFRVQLFAWPVQRFYSSPELRKVCDEGVWISFELLKGVARNCMSVIKLNDKNDLLVYNVRNPTPQLIEQVKAVGNVTHMIVPNTAHDSYAAFWKQLFPDCKVYCPKAVVDILKDCVEITGSIEEEMPKLDGWECKVYSTEDCFGAKTLTESWVSMQQQNTKIFLGGCAMVTEKPMWYNPISMFLTFLSGAWGPKLSPLGMNICRVDCKKLKNLLTEIDSEKPWTAIIGLHGAPIVGAETEYAMRYFRDSI